MTPVPPSRVVLGSVRMRSSAAAEEARRNLERKFPSRVAALAALLQSLIVVPSGTERGCQLELLVKDRPVFEFALRVKATQLLGGDLKDFGAFMNKRNKTQGVFVQTVDEFLNSVV